LVEQTHWIPVTEVFVVSSINYEFTQLGSQPEAKRARMIIAHAVDFHVLCEGSIDFLLFLFYIDKI
jgi:hypothetical protein